MKTFIKNFLTYSRREKRGTVMLLILLMAISVFRLYLPRMVPASTAHDFTEYREEIAEFRVAVRKASDSIDSVKQATKERRNTPAESRRNFPHDKFLRPADTIIVELNTCDTLDLQILRGIGPYFAKNIIKYRELLGGYTGKEQLLEVYGMDSSRFMQIEERVTVVKTDLRKIDLNEGSFKSFLRHPYLEFYLVKEIFRYREKNGFDSVGELKKVHLVTDELYKKVSPYLYVETKQAGELK